MSFVVSASTEEELEEKTSFFIEAVTKMKEAAANCLLHSVPVWAIKEKEFSYIISIRLSCAKYCAATYPSLDHRLVILGRTLWFYRRLPSIPED